MDLQSTDEDEKASGGYSARELAELAGTTVRTIHYYSAEGLLPPPVGSTRNATYTEAHLARLTIIAALRDEGLALGKIRERLAPLTDEQVARVAAALAEHLAAGEGAPVTTLGLIDLEVTRQSLTPDDLSDSGDQSFGELYSQPSPSRAKMYVPQPAGSAREYLDRVLRREAPPRPSPSGPAAPAQHPLARKPQSPEPAEVWHQYRLGDGIELRLREDRYRQIKGRPSALIDAVRSSLRRYAPVDFLDQQEDDPTNQ